MKLTKPLAFIDIESTGADPAKDRIISLAIHTVTPITNTTHSQEIIVNPTIPISPDATAVHGFTDEMVADKKPFEHYAARIHEDLEDCDLAGYNLRNFDVPLLWEEFFRCGIEWDLSKTHIIDVYNIFRKKEPRDLSAAVKVFCGREHEGAHGADADAKATADVLYGMRRRYEDLPATVAELAKFSTLDDRLDLAGKFIRNDKGVVVYNFGKNRGQPVQDDPSLAEWLLKKDFTANTKVVARQLLNEIYRSQNTFAD